MPGPKPPAINLNDVERQGLELPVRRYATGQQKVGSSLFPMAKPELLCR